MIPISPFGLPIGLSIAFWMIIGSIRKLYELFILPKREASIYTLPTPHSDEIAAILPAHNEGLVVHASVRALMQSLSPYQIYVISDGSTDNTVEEAKKEMVNVVDLTPGRGKAKAIVHALETYKLFERYNFIFIIDADTLVDKSFVPNALPMFRDPDISVVFAAPRIRWPKDVHINLGSYFIAYRERLNLILRYLLMYGQTWKFTNTNYVIPGFCTIYRSKILKQLEIDTPGLLIEDFNLAFQLHKKKLGKIGFDFKLFAWDQHPDNLPDYWKQVRRWNIGFFQTVRKNGIWPSFYWLALGVFTIEVFANSIFVALLPIILIGLAAPYFPPGTPVVTQAAWLSNATLPEGASFAYLYILLIIFDYTVSVMMGLIHKRMEFIIYGPFFMFMHYVTSLILMTAVIPGLITSSSGRWISPKRQKVALIHAKKE